MLRRCCEVVITEEYVQEHILIDGIVAPLDAPRQLIHGRLQPFRSAFSRHTRHISSGQAAVVLVLRVAVARSNATRSTISRHADAAHMIDDGLLGGFLPMIFGPFCSNVSYGVNTLHL